MLLVQNVHLASLVFMDFPSAKVKIETFKTQVFKKMMRILKFFSACGCSSSGSSMTSCNAIGECTCKSNVVGTKCTACKPGYFGFPNCQGENENMLII